MAKIVVAQVKWFAMGSWYSSILCMMQHKKFNICEEGLRIFMGFSDTKTVTHFTLKSSFLEGKINLAPIFLQIFFFALYGTICTHTTHLCGTGHLQLLSNEQRWEEVTKFGNLAFDLQWLKKPFQCLTSLICGGNSKPDWIGKIMEIFTGLALYPGFNLSAHRKGLMKDLWIYAHFTIDYALK